MTREQWAATNMVLELAKSRVKYLGERCVYEVPPAMVRGMSVVEEMLLEHRLGKIIEPCTARPTRRLELGGEHGT